MKKMMTGLLIAILLSVIVLPGVQSESKRVFGRFVEISHEKYTGLNSMKIVEYLVYERDTHVVYVYTTDGTMMLSITPYLMRNVYGEMTFGVYDPESGVIMPAEPYLDENGEVWVIAG